MSYNINVKITLLPTDIGLTLNAQLVDNLGVDFGAPITSGIFELGGGSYFAVLTGLDDGWSGAIKFYVDGTPSVILAGTAINPVPDVSLISTTLDNTVVGVKIVIIRGDTFIYRHTTTFIDTADRTELIFSIKNDDNDPQEDSVIRLSESVGLEIVNGEPYGIPSDGSITVTTDGLRYFIDIQLSADVTTLLDNLTGDKRWDIQITVGALVKTLVLGRCDVLYSISS